MPRKRFLGASLALHACLLTAIALAADVHIHGRPLAARPLPSEVVKLVDVPTPAPQPTVAPPSPIAYPHVAPTPRPTPLAQKTPGPRHTPSPRHTPRPKPSLKPKELDAYRKKLPELAHRPKSEAEAIAERLKKLGLDPSAAASMDSAVQIAINAGSDKMYHPTTPGATGSAAASGSATAQASGSAFALPTAWASPSTPLEDFLSRVLPPDKGYDADLTFDASGKPELRIRYRNGILAAGKELVFVEHWDPSAPGTPSVDVSVFRSDGKLAGRFVFQMIVPPGGQRDQFIDAMAGASMLGYLQGGPH